VICKPCKTGGAWNALAQNGATLPAVAKDAARKAASSHQKCAGGTWCDCEHAIEKAINDQSVR